MRACWAKRSEPAGWSTGGWLQAYVVCQTVAGLFAAQAGHTENAIRRLDLALVTGGPCEELRELIALIPRDRCPEIASLLPISVPKESVVMPTPTPGAVPLSRYQISSEDDYSEFQSRHVSTRVVAVLEGVQEDWGAKDAWSDLPALVAEHGHRWVPIEVGLWPTLDEQLVTIADFFVRYFSGDEKGPAYLAQHNLFEQIPELRQNVKVPHLIAALGRDLADMNVWWGTAGTRTPLHYDTHDNLFCQVSASFPTCVK